MKINLEIWESAQRLIELIYLRDMDCGFDDTSDLYDSLMENVAPNQIDNFVAMICRNADPVNLGDCFVDGEYNIFKIVKCDFDKQILHLQTNGCQFLEERVLADFSDFILNNWKLVKEDEYYQYLDIAWETREGIYFDKKDIKRVDFKKVEP